VPLLVDCVGKGRLDWLEFLRLTQGAWEYHNIACNGLMVIDRKKEWKITAGKLHSKCRWTPYEGMRVKGAVEKVFLREKMIVDSGEFVEN